MIEVADLYIVTSERDIIRIPEITENRIAQDQISESLLTSTSTFRSRPVGFSDADSPSLAYALESPKVYSRYLSFTSPIALNRQISGESALPPLLCGYSEATPTVTS